MSGKWVAWAHRHSYVRAVSRVQQIEAELRNFSAAELQQVRDWLDDMIEDSLEFTDEFEAQVRESEREMNVGVRPRVRPSEPPR